jgi:hypothetical protein
MGGAALLGLDGCAAWGPGLDVSYALIMMSVLGRACSQALKIVHYVWHACLYMVCCLESMNAAAEGLSDLSPHSCAWLPVQSGHQPPRAVIELCLCSHSALSG